MMTKEKIREEIKRKLEGQGEKERLERSRKIQEALFHSEAFQRAKCILIYVSFNGEVDTRGIIRKCFSMGKRVVVPKVNVEEACVNLREIRDDGSLVKGTYGIPEPREDRSHEARPEEIDCVILPGVAFDRSGRRLGRGGGFFDKLLSAIPAKVPRIALAFSFQVVDRLPVNGHDRPVDRVLQA